MTLTKGPSGNPSGDDTHLTAVVVADSFDARFQPLTLERPRCLLPLLNQPLLSHTLEMLALTGRIAEILIVCCSHAQLISDYIGNSKWGSSLYPRVSVVVSKELLSIGDVLRELDTRLTTDFVLLNGDTVGNVDLSAAVMEHQKRRETDKNAIMTMVLKQASPQHASRYPFVFFCQILADQKELFHSNLYAHDRDKAEESLFVLDANTGECLHYDSLSPNQKKKKTCLNLEIFDKHSKVEIRNDLIDCQIDICSIEVPALLTENFDYQDIRKDFVRGILESDLLGKTLFCHVLTDKYAARVSCPQMYDSVRNRSRDVMGRWTYPLVPDSNFLSNTSFEFFLPSLYRESPVSLSNSAKLLGKTLVGSGTRIGRDSLVKDSVIGRHCHIGDHVVLDRVYLMEDCVIQDGTTITNSILSTKVKVGSGVTIEQGCLFGPGVRIGDKAKIGRCTRWVATPDSNASPLLGKTGYGIEFKAGSDNSDVDWENLARLSLGTPYHRATSMDEESMDGDLSDTSNDENEWIKEVQLTLERAVKENHTVDIAGLELNTLKMAFNISFHDLRSVSIPFLMQQIQPTSATTSSKQIFGKWAGLIQRIVHSNDDQMDVLDILSNHVLKSDLFLKTFLPIVHTLYDYDILEETVIVKWYGLQHGGRIKESLTPFVNWLNEAEEESSASDHEEEEEDGDKTN